MNLPKVVRVFFAVDLPDTTKTGISKFISGLKKQSKSRVIRWTNPENLHITLQFLAEVKSEHINDLITNVRTEIKDIIQSSAISFDKIHIFPNPYRPRVIVLDISPQEELAKLAQAIGHGITNTNYAIETRPFRAHLTIGRIKQPHGIDLQFLTDAHVPRLEAVKLSEIVLFRSEPQAHGSLYTIIERFTL